MVILVLEPCALQSKVTVGRCRQERQIVPHKNRDLSLVSWSVVAFGFQVFQELELSGLPG